MKAEIDEDDATVRLLIRESAELRRRRLDRGTGEIVAYAREEAELDCWVALMTTPPERKAA